MRGVGFFALIIGTLFSAGLVAAPVSAVSPTYPAISLSELPVPPTAPSNTAGSCTLAVNPNGTGCISSVSNGGFLDNDTLGVTFTYAGAPTTGPSSIYTGSQFAMIKTDGTTFPDGDAWQCITCGKGGSYGSGSPDSQVLDNGLMLFTGGAIETCGGSYTNSGPVGLYQFTDPNCYNNPSVKIMSYPLRWSVKTPDSGAGGSTSGLKLNPDGVHVAWNVTSGISENVYYGRLQFDPTPPSGTTPAVPRYDIVDVYGFYPGSTAEYLDTCNDSFYHIDSSNPNQLDYYQGCGDAEFKGWSADGQSIIDIGNAVSDSLDHFADNVQTGVMTRIDNGHGYSDPDTASPDGNWHVAMATRGGRDNYIGGLPDVPPITDIAGTGGAVADGYRINTRRFFVPYLQTMSGADAGEQLNACTTGPCSTFATTPASDAQSIFWFSLADSSWSPDSTEVSYTQNYSPAADCGPPFDATACPASSEPGGRTSRIMLATLSQAPTQPLSVPVQPDTIPWGTPVPTGTNPVVPSVAFPSGTYTVNGASSGSASVTIASTGGTTYQSISVTYSNYSDDGVDFINGTESITLTPQPNTSTNYTFQEALTDNAANGAVIGTKTTSPSGYTINNAAVAQSIYQPVGTMTTVLNGVTYNQPSPWPPYNSNTYATPSTTTSAPTSSSVVLGNSNTDSATVTSAVSANPTGTVTFYSCGADVVPCTQASPSWSQVGTPVTLSGSSNPETVSSGSVTPDSTGTWCFAAVYSGDAQNPSSADNSTDECYTVASPPSAPANVSATAGNGQATVSFTAPFAGNSPITSYTVTATDTTYSFNGGETASGTSSPITIAGLTNGDTYTFTVTATNGIGTGPSSNPSNSVTPTDLQPNVFTSASTVGIAAGKAVDFKVTATGNPAPTITSLGSLPSWLTFKPGTTGTKAHLKGTAPANSGGSYTFTLEAANQVEPPAYQQFNVNVLQITSGTTATAYANQPFSFDVTTSDTPTNPTLTATGLPAGLIFTDNGDGTGVINGPASHERLSVKTYAVKIKATSGSVVSKQTLDITVYS